MKPIRARTARSPSPARSSPAGTTPGPRGQRPTHAPLIWGVPRSESHPHSACIARPIDDPLEAPGAPSRRHGRHRAGLFAGYSVRSRQIPWTHHMGFAPDLLHLTGDGADHLSYLNTDPGRVPNDAQELCTLRFRIFSTPNLGLESANLGYTERFLFLFSICRFA